MTVDAPPDAVMAEVRELGGDDRWHGYDLLWSLRAWGDALIGGVGARRGRRPGSYRRVYGAEPTGCSSSPSTTSCSAGC